jgi:hypothetical protein
MGLPNDAAEAHDVAPEARQDNSMARAKHAQSAPFRVKSGQEHEVRGRDCSDVRYCLHRWPAASL